MKQTTTSDQLEEEEDLNSNKDQIDESLFRLKLLSVGSNSHGQLGLNHRDDVDRFQGVKTWYGRQGLKILSFSAGARHSIFLVRSDDRLILYGSGDSSYHQIPPISSVTNVDKLSPKDSKFNRVNKENNQIVLEREDASHQVSINQITNINEIKLSDLIDGLTNINDKSFKQILLNDYEPIQVGCCWETSFIVLRNKIFNNNQQIQEGRQKPIDVSYDREKKGSEGYDDHIISFGSNDFQLRGSTSIQPVISINSSIFKSNLVDFPKSDRGRPRKIFKIINGPKNVITVIGSHFHHSSEGGEEGDKSEYKFVDLVGWGATRHKQLGPIDSKDTSKFKKNSTLPINLNFPFPNSSCSSKGKNNLIDPSKLQVSMGKEHTVLIYRNQMIGWGNNRFDQINFSKINYLLPQKPDTNDSTTEDIIHVGTCWNSTIIIYQTQRDNQIYSSIPINQINKISNKHHGGVEGDWTIIFGLGNNSQTQLGKSSQLFSLKTESSDERDSNSRGEEEQQKILRNLVIQRFDKGNDLSCSKLITGSEHVLLVDKSLKRVYGWGWNEHGNLTNNQETRQELEPEKSEINHLENHSNCKEFGLVFEVSDENELISDVFAGCATTFICLKKKIK
ncbi:regulator of chromosome condensation 1/beta-lactamase-inhibitor protein II [Phakopsora pachyrhizi]|uniref:Regulator of chromosome condensation 1/beta-lactamase-inhibitor protein II n=1 Tax=Phakopsora pachyrhizi TaxID=170000 RepID=A0AAV0AK56_PHAPC|nr:regulator of chromosome condensation 1/beta-lactamase-inhibitor protein II [Phakopsora pachyrhizi]